MRQLLQSCLFVVMWLMIFETHAKAETLLNRQGAHKNLVSALKHGDYALARSEAMRHDDATSLLARAILSTMDGKLVEATHFAQVALQKATDPQDKDQAIVILARLERAQGDHDAAEARLRDALKVSINAHGVRFELGDLLMSQGKKNEAHTILNVFSALFNQGVLKTSQDMTYLARAMALTQSFDDANYAFEQAVHKDPKNPDALAYWGQLLLSKYNIADAQRSFKEALSVNKNHPLALIGMATVEMFASNQSDRARKFLDRVVAVAPLHPQYLLANAHLALRDGDCKSARRFAHTLLKTRPKNLEGKTIGVVCDYLYDDMKAYAKSKASVLKLNPKYAQVLSTTANYGIRVHRYVEAMDLFREALKIVPDHSDSLLGLGIGLSRVGKEDEAVDFLRRAFDADPYNVRAFNMVELYEKELTKYNFTDYSKFKLRSHKDQTDMIELIVAPVVKESMAAFDKKYGFSPHKYLAVEVYPHTPTFSVRSVGLPNISPHGICFGRVVTVRSPSDGNFNWRQVVWHEMAHVYHIQLSKSRVPRWFTEGLAEYETNVYDASWQRHHDREIAVKLFTEGVPSVLHYNRGFTHAKSHSEVLRSYHLASLAIHFIAETWGFDVLPTMLRTWGDKKTTTHVLASVLKTDVAGFDAKFLVWLKRRYMNFEHQMMIDLDGVGNVEELEAKKRRHGLNPHTRARLAIAYLRARQPMRAETELKRALEISPKDATVNYIALMLRSSQGKAREALEHGNLVLGAFKDGYDLRLAMARAALAMEKPNEARVHYNAATQMYPTGGEAWSALGRLATTQEHKKLYEQSLSRSYMLNQHDPNLARVRYESLSKARKYGHAWDAVQRWLDINPFDVAAHRAVIDVGTKLAKKNEVVRSWQSIILLRRSEKSTLYLEAITFFGRMGWREQAQMFAVRAKKDGVDAIRVDAALNLSSQ